MDTPYKPKIATLSLMVPSTLGNVNITEKKEKSFFSGLFSFFSNIFKKEKNDYRLIELQFKESTGKSYYDFLYKLLTIEDGLQKVIDENSSIDEDKALLVLYQSNILSSLEEVCYQSSISDDMIKFILSDNNVGVNLDFVEFLTVEQRIKIIETFRKVNPRIIEAEKKIPKDQIKSMKYLMDLQEVIQQAKDIQGMEEIVNENLP